MALTAIVGVTGMFAILTLLAQVQHPWLATAMCVCVISVFSVAGSLGVRGERLWRRTRLRPRGLMKFLRRGQAETCSYCHDAMPAAETAACVGCGAVYHAACQEELLGGCGTLGCSERQRVRLVHPAKKGAVLR